MTALAWLLDLGYGVVLLGVVAATVVRARRQRSTRPLRPVVGTFASAAVIAFAINFAYAQAAAAEWLWLQVLVTAVFTAAVLFVLKGFDAALRRATTWLAARAPAGVKPRARAALAVTVRVALLFLLGMPYVMAVAMVHRPKVRGPDPMEMLGARFEDVTFDNGRLSGWWIPAVTGHSEDTVLLCHGLGSSKSNALPMAEHLLRAGYNVFAFDFRAHGASAGHVTTFGDAERHDVLAALRWLSRERPRESRRVHGLGASMGAAALLAAAADGSAEGLAVGAVAVYGTYDDLGALARTVCDRHFPPPLNWLGRRVAVPIAGLHAGTDLHGFVPAASVSRLTPRPVLVIHGRGDEIIAFEHGRQLFEAAGEPKRALWLDGDHNSVLADSGAARKVREFFDAAREGRPLPD